MKTYLENVIVYVIAASVAILCLPLIIGSYFRYGLAKAPAPSFKYYQPLQWKEED